MQYFVAILSVVLIMIPIMIIILHRKKQHHVSPFLVKPRVKAENLRRQKQIAKGMLKEENGLINHLKYLTTEEVKND